MSWINTIIAVIGLLRAAWGLWKDVKKQDPSMDLQNWATRYQGAIQGFRESETKDIGELKALTCVIGDKLCSPEAPLP